MSDTLVVDAIDQLKPLLNDKNVLEIVVRGQKRRIKAFQKVALATLPKSEEKEAIEKVVDGLNKNTLLNNQSINLLGQVAKSQQLALLLNGFNLCATFVGFAIMYKKLDSMSEKINQQLALLKNTVKQGNDVYSNYEYNKILSEHMNMLDCQKKKQPYSEAQMRELVDGEYNVLLMLIDVYRKEQTADHKTLIFSIFALLSMLAVSLRNFDEIYYKNNHDQLEGEDIWHAMHDNWMSVFSTLTSEWFVEKLQDYAIFETNLNTLGADVYYINLLDQVIECRQEIIENQTLILAAGDIELLHLLKDYSIEDLNRELNTAIRETLGDQIDPAVMAFLNKVKKQVAVA